MLKSGETAAREGRRWNPAKRVGVGSSAFLALLLSAATSSATDTLVDVPITQGPRTAKDTSVSTDSDWYGWQLLLVDGIGIGAGVAALEFTDFRSEDRPPDVGLVGGVWYGVGAVAAPAVHYAHGRAGPGLGSFALRTFLPPLGGVLGVAGNCLGHEFEGGCSSDGFVGGSLLGLVGAAAIDAALISQPKPAKESAEQKYWYGWQLLVLDGAAIGSGAMLAATARNAEGERPHPAIAIWVPGYVVGFFGGPIVHFAHGRWGTGFASFGLRAAGGPLGVLPGVMGYCAATGGTSGCARSGALWGLTGGLAAASLLDALVLAHEPSEADEQALYMPRVMVGPGSVAVAGYWP